MIKTGFVAKNRTTSAISKENLHVRATVQKNEQILGIWVFHVLV